MAEEKIAEKKKEAIKKEGTEKGKAKRPVKEKKQKEARKIVLDPSVDPFQTIEFVLMTEKCVRMIEAQNKLVFIVRRNSRKKAIRKAVENAYQSPVQEITTLIDQRGRKRAFVKFSTAGAAGDIAIRLGIL